MGGGGVILKSDVSEASKNWGRRVCLETFFEKVLGDRGAQRSPSVSSEL